MVYVDNPFNTRIALRTFIPTLGLDLYPGDLGVKWDIFHVIQLLRDTTRANHPTLTTAFEELKSAMFVPHPTDPVGSKRNLVPPPHVLLPRIKAWATKWTRSGFDARTGQHIFTIDTYKCLKRMMRACVEWMLSGEY